MILGLGKQDIQVTKTTGSQSLNAKLQQQKQQETESVSRQI